MRRRFVAAALTSLAVVLPLIQAAPAHATGPVIEHARYTDVLAPDDFFITLCGITQNTTVIELDILKTFPDGSQQFHVQRTFIPDDPRLPVERDAGTSFWADQDTPLKFVGEPLKLFKPDGGVLILDSGQTRFTDDGVIVHGRADVDPDSDLAPYYCPSPQP